MMWENYIGSQQNLGRQVVQLTSKTGLQTKEEGDS